MDFTRLFEILEYQQQRFPQKVAFAGRLAGGWRTWSTEQMLAARDRLSAGLIALGLAAGERVGIVAHCGSPEWIITDAALLQIGLVPVPIHATARPDEVAHIVKDAGLVACFVSNADMLERLKASPTLPPIIIAFDKIEGAIFWEEVTSADPAPVGQIAVRREAITEATLATLLYTSGTTGLPKGVMLSHGNIVSNIKAVLTIVPLDGSITTMSFLPLSHIFERMVTYVYQAAGASVWFADAVEHLPRLLPEVRPQLFTAVPRVLERVYERVLEARNRAGWLGRKIFDWALALGEQYPLSGTQGKPLHYRLQLALADLLVFRRWRKALGGRLRYIAVGAAALQPRLGRLFSAAGIAVREGYGLTETSPVISFNRFEPGGVHFGTVGIPAPGVEVRISTNTDDASLITHQSSLITNPEGEVEVRGPNIMLGYWNLPEETAAKFTPDGWLKTGDLGHFEFKRFLKITGRRSEIFKTTTGKFVAPAFVEEQLLTSPLIEQCLAVGLNQPFVGALLVPNFDSLEAWCRANKVHWTAPEYMILNPKVEKLYRQEIERINEESLGAIEKVRAFRLLGEAWTAENGLLTPTLKLRREAIAGRFAGEIGELFKPEAKP